MDHTTRKEQLNFAGILKLLYSNQKSGVLKVRSPEGELNLHFMEGKIVGVETPRGQEWVIGDYLVEGKVLSVRRLIKAVNIASRKGLSPEEVLVRKGYISPDVLRRYMDLYSREVILPLFSKVGLVCSFLQETPQSNRWLPPVSVPFLLREGEKRAHEWPLLTKRIPSAAVVYDKDKSFISQILKEGEEGTTPLFSDKLNPELGANERIVYYFVDGKKSVKQLSRSSGLDLFSTYKALFNLENKSMVKVVGSQGTQVPKEAALIPYIVKGFFYLLILAVVAGLIVIRPGPLKILSGERGVDVQEMARALDRAKDKAVSTRLEEAFVTKAFSPTPQCPPSLETLVREGYLEGVDVDIVRYLLRCDVEAGYRLERGNGIKSSMEEGAD